MHGFMDVLHLAWRMAFFGAGGNLARNAGDCHLVCSDTIDRKETARLDSENNDESFVP